MATADTDASRHRAERGPRVPPHNLQAEESLLGAMLLSRDAIAAAVEIVSIDDFYKPAHGHIFDAITSLFGSGEPVDPVTVADELRRAGLLDAIGGTAVLITIQSNTPATTSAPRYARIVEEHALLRRLIAVGGEIAEIGYDLPDDVPKAVDRAESMVYEVAQRRVTDTMAPIGELLGANLDRLEKLYERGETVTGVPTGYLDLDELLSGLQKSALVVVGARPSMGKCVSKNARVFDPVLGTWATIEELCRRGTAGDEVCVLALDESKVLVGAVPSHFVDDGIKPVWKVRTRLGREVTTTITHPFLTPTGWRPLADIGPGTRVAVPRSLPFFGDARLRDSEVKILGYLIGDGGLTGTTPKFTNASPVLVDEVRHCADELGGKLVWEKGGNDLTYRIVAPDRFGNGVTEILRDHGLMGLNSHAKFVPAAIFQCPKDQIAMFLSRLFATDGSAWWTDTASGRGYGRVSYCTVSKQLARDVQHLLLRFGLNARIREKWVKYKGTRRRAFELELMSAPEIRRFAAEIGIYSKEGDLEHLLSKIEATGEGYTRDTLPVETWSQVLATKGTRSWAHVSDRAGKPRNHNWHVAKSAPRRESVRKLAIALDDMPLMNEAMSDVYWDDVVAITYEGEQQVYDLTVPVHHNFVADDVIVHNTSFALGIASHAAVEAQRPVLFFSLEMSQLELSQRMLCSEARVDSTKVRTGRLASQDWTKIHKAVGRLAEAPVYIDDNPNLTIMEIRAKARRLRSRIGDLGVVIVDYVQLMSGRSRAENRQVEVSEISRGLKILARELDAPVIALAQLNRQLESRADKRPMLSDLRESGSLEQDADVVLFLYRDDVYNDDTPDRGTAEVIVAKHRNGPTGKVRLAWLEHHTRFDNMAKHV